MQWHRLTNIAGAFVSFVATEDVDLRRAVQGHCRTLMNKIKGGALAGSGGGRGGRRRRQWRDSSMGGYGG